MPTRSRARSNSILVITLFAISLALAFEAARSKAACYDEPKHVATGAYACVEGRFLGDDNAPIVALFGWAARLHDWRLPPVPTELTATGKRLGLYDSGVEMLAHGAGAASITDALFWPRMTSLVLFGLLLVFVAIEGRARGGQLGMLTALGLSALSPVLLSHASIVSADLPLALAGVVVARALRRYGESATDSRARWLGLALALALVTKLTGVVLALGAGACLAPRLLDDATRRLTLRHALLASITFFIAISLATNLDPGFFWRQWQLVSHYGDAQRTDFYRGTLGAGAFGFYPVVFLLKLEPAYYVALCVLAAVWWRARARCNGALPVLVLAALVFLATLASGYRQGFRFLLPMWPLLAIACAHAFDREDSRPAPRARAIAASIVVLSAFSAFGARPDYLSYWNPLARGHGDAWFVDSNHDWGQDLTTLVAWQHNAPDAVLYGALYTIVPPALYGVHYANLFDDPTTLTHFDSTQRNYIVFSVSLLRMLAADAKQPLHPIAMALLSEQPNLDFGGSIRGFELTAERLTRLLGKP